GRAVVAPHMISGKILDVLPVEAQELDGLVLPASIGMQLLIGGDATVAELTAVGPGAGLVGVVASLIACRITAQASRFQTAMVDSRLNAFSRERRIGEQGDCST